jgi:hypothetical protein
LAPPQNSGMITQTSETQATQTYKTNTPTASSQIGKSDPLIAHTTIHIHKNILLFFKLITKNLVTCPTALFSTMTPMQRSSFPPSRASENLPQAIARPR